MNFPHKVKFDNMDFWEIQEIILKARNWQKDQLPLVFLKVPIKNDKVIFYVAWNNMFTDYWKVLLYKFGQQKVWPFLRQKVDK